MGTLTKSVLSAEWIRLVKFTPTTVTIVFTDGGTITIESNDVLTIKETS